MPDLNKSWFSISQFYKGRKIKFKSGRKTFLHALYKFRTYLFRFDSKPIVWDLSWFVSDI